VETFEEWFIRQLEGEVFVKYKRIRRWTEHYGDWLKKNNQEPADYVTRRWLRDEIDELRECIEEILYPREETQSPRWVGLTDEEIKEIIGPWGDTPIKGYTRKLFDQIEAKLKEKNGG